MTIENGTAIVLAYVLVSMGVIIAFLLAAFVIGWFIGSAASAPPRTARRRVTYWAVGTLHLDFPSRMYLPRFGGAFLFCGTQSRRPGLPLCGRRKTFRAK